MYTSPQIVFSFVLLAEIQSSRSSFVKTFQNLKCYRPESKWATLKKNIDQCEDWVGTQCSGIWRIIDHSKLHGRLVISACSIVHLHNQFHFPFLTLPRFLSLSVLMRLLRSYSSITNRGSNDVCWPSLSHRHTMPLCLLCCSVEKPKSCHMDF